MGRLFACALVAAWVATLIPETALAWGSEGHRVVGAVADRILKKDDPAIYQKVQNLLGGETLEEAAIWADCAKGFTYCHRAPSDAEKAYTAKNRHHHNYHYTDVPVGQPSYVGGTAGTEPYDIVQVLKYAIEVMRAAAHPGGVNDPHGPADVHLSPSEAVWLTAHLVGDLHQPLHVGAIYFDEDCAHEVDPNVAGANKPDFGIGTTVADTEGGNFLMINSKSLHSYWDDTTVEHAAKDAAGVHATISSFADKLVSAPPPNWKTAGDPTDWPEEWADQTLDLAREALGWVELAPVQKTNNDQKLDCRWHVTRPQGYDQWASGVAEMQLAKAGYRLAAVLEAAFAAQ